MIYAGGVERLYVHSPDRLARQFVHQAVLLDEFAKRHVEVVFLNQPAGDAWLPNAIATAAPVNPSHTALTRASIAAASRPPSAVPIAATPAATVARTQTGRNQIVATSSATITAALRMRVMQRFVERDQRWPIARESIAP